MTDLFFELLNEHKESREEGYDFFQGTFPVSKDFLSCADAIERINAIVSAKLRLERESVQLSEITFARALDKVSAFIYAMKGSFDEGEDTLEYETIIDDSVVVKFKGHPKMRLNIYYDEESLGEDNPEESYLLYENHGRMTLVSDTIRNNVDLIRHLLSI